MAFTQILPISAPLLRSVLIPTKAPVRFHPRTLQDNRLLLSCARIFRSSRLGDCTVMTHRLVLSSGNHADHNRLTVFPPPPCHLSKRTPACDVCARSCGRLSRHGAARPTAAENSRVSFFALVFFMVRLFIVWAWPRADPDRRCDTPPCRRAVL